MKSIIYSENGKNNNRKEKRKQLWNRCQMWGKTKAKNSEIGENVTWFDIWENYFLLSFSSQSHFQVSTKWESFFCFFSMPVSNYLRLHGQENFRSQRGQVPPLAPLWLRPCTKQICIFIKYRFGFFKRTK